MIVRTSKAIVRNSGLFVFCWATFILLVCATPGRFIPSAGWLQLLSADKLVHAALFFVLGFGIIISAHRKELTTATLILLLMLAALYGFLIEILQANLFIERSFEVYDGIADAAGVLISVFVRNRILRWAFT